MEENVSNVFGDTNTARPKENVLRLFAPADLYQTITENAQEWAIFAKILI